MPAVTALALLRKDGSDGEHSDGADADQGSAAENDSSHGERVGRKDEVAVGDEPVFTEGDACGRPRVPTTNATTPMMIALVASTKPRRGVAVKVVRIRPRRYSTVDEHRGDHDDHDQCDQESEPDDARRVIATSQWVDGE